MTDPRKLSFNDDLATHDVYPPIDRQAAAPLKAESSISLFDVLGIWEHHLRADPAIVVAMARQGGQASDNRQENTAGRL